MGNYLNSTNAYTMYSEVFRSPFFVDKTKILDKLIPRIKTTEKFICITRPRRFGKSVMADMVAAFLDLQKQRLIFCLKNIKKKKKLPK